MSTHGGQASHNLSVPDEMNKSMKETEIHCMDQIILSRVLRDAMNYIRRSVGHCLRFLTFLGFFCISAPAFHLLVFVAYSFSLLIS